MTICAIGTIVSYGMTLAAENTKGAAKKPAPVVKECAELDEQKHPVKAQACFERALQADPNYADDQLKDVTKLTAAEWQEVDGLCQAVLNNYFSDIFMEFRSVYYNLPKADGSGLSSVVNGKKLAKPLRVYTVVPGSLRSLAADNNERKAGIIAGLKKQIPLVEAHTAAGKTYRIVRAFVRFEDGLVSPRDGARDGVTIVPDRVSVFYTK
jgi:hypothetical protein